MVTERAGFDLDMMVARLQRLRSPKDWFKRHDPSGASRKAVGVKPLVCADVDGRSPQRKAFGQVKKRIVCPRKTDCSEKTFRGKPTNLIFPSPEHLTPAIAPPSPASVIVF
ncbi:hypothetical protein GCM10007036_18520 [Alsobacter metallidurans]|uniref:Uncharacterized protein n=1 Tax=Alsobacter metallidurans TaxID=340221 RepID=A0A917MJE1_9HYPH|nr:hypothetical protein GCM10007036_18520 [Alsobacter metallidurans]